MFIGALASFGFIRSDKAEDREELATGFSDFLICIEMAIMSVAHCVIFSASEHQYGFFVLSTSDSPGEHAAKVSELDPLDALVDVVLGRDIIEDIILMAKSVPRLSMHGAIVVARGTRNTSPPALVDRYQWESSRYRRRGGPQQQEEVPLGSSELIENSPDIAKLRKKLQEARSPEERLTWRAKLAEAEHLTAGSNGLYKVSPWA